MLKFIHNFTKTGLLGENSALTPVNYRLDLWRKKDIAFLKIVLFIFTFESFIDLSTNCQLLPFKTGIPRPSPYIKNKEKKSNPDLQFLFINKFTVNIFNDSNHKSVYSINYCNILLLFRHKKNIMSLVSLTSILFYMHIRQVLVNNEKFERRGLLNA